jgi:proline iminopeptidase
MDTTEGYITAEPGIRLFYKKTGNGRKIVIVPNGFYYFNELEYLADFCTLVCYDVRNRGLSDSVSDSSKLGGIHQDVADLESVRSHFGFKKIHLIGHSYIGLMVGLYAIQHASNVNRVIQISPTQPDAGKEYPAYLTNQDQLLKETFSKIAQYRQEPTPADPVERCKKFWSILNAIYFVDQRYATEIDWGRCELANERTFMKYFTEQITPSIQKIHLKKEDLRSVKPKFLIIHGTMDRSAPYGGGREWSLILPNARLLTVPNVAHAPWIEAPEMVFPAMKEFLAGKWPAKAEKVKTI